MKTGFLDLFAGIGGFLLGAHNAGLRFDYYYYSEIDPYAVAVYQKRFREAGRYNRSRKLPLR